MNRGPGVGLATIATIAASFLALPVIVLVGRAFISGELAGALASPVVIDALVLSLITTASSLVIVVVFGLPLALYLARTSGGRSKVWLETAVDLPIVLPPSVAGLALLLVFGSRGLIGQSLSAFGISIPFTTFAVVLAQVFVAAPFFIRSARAGISGVENDLEDAARVDGATERHVLRWITVPLAAPALAAGLVMTWARALGEFGATIMFAGNIEGRTQTLPLLVYSQFQSSLDASIAGAAVLVLAALGVLAAVRLTHWRAALDVRGAL